MALITDSEIEKIAQKLVENITEENWEKLRKKAEEMKLPSEYASIPCTSCKCKCGTYTTCKTFSEISCLCKEFGHNYCQGIINGMREPRRYSNSDCFSGTDLKNIPNFKVCRLALRLMANDSVSATPTYSIADVIISILAWGGANIAHGGHHWRTWIASSTTISSLSTVLKNINTTGYNDSNMEDLLKLPGIAISFASKFMFFYSKKNDSYILDKFTNENLVNILGFESVYRILGFNNKEGFIYRLNNISRQIELYKLYNTILKKMAKVLNLTSGELVEILLFK